MLKNKLPYAQIDGGGHKRAGSIGFIEAAKEEIMKIAEDYVSGIKK